MKNAGNIFSSFIACVLVCAISYAQPAFAVNSSYFNMDEKRSDNITPFPKWTGMLSRFAEQKLIPDSACDKIRYHPCSILEWKRLLESTRSKPFSQQLDIVNTWGNSHPYIEDQVNWGVEDYWETPYEFMEVSGDCEDYAISKYYTRKALGVPVERLRIIVLQDLNLGGIIHAVLGVYDGGKLYILDNQSSQVKPALKIYHYRPIFGINETSWWAYYPK